MHPIAGDSACSIPPQTIAAECLEVIRDWTPKIAKALKVVGLINIQYAIQDGQVCLPFLSTLPTLQTRFCTSHLHARSCVGAFPLSAEPFTSLCPHAVWPPTLL